MTIRTIGAVPEPRRHELAEFTADQRTTERVLCDLEQAGLTLDDIVAMDEYTLDLIIALPDGLTLVYDTT